MNRKQFKNLENAGKGGAAIVVISTIIEVVKFASKTQKEQTQEALREYEKEMYDNRSALYKLFHKRPK